MFIAGCLFCAMIMQTIRKISAKQETLKGLLNH